MERKEIIMSNSKKYYEILADLVGFTEQGAIVRLNQNWGADIYEALETHIDFDDNNDNELFTSIALKIEDGVVVDIKFII